MVVKGTTVEQILKNTQHGKVSPNGYDLSVKEIKFISGGGAVFKNKTVLSEYILCTADKKNCFELPVGIYSVTFNEGGKIPQGYCAWIKTRSSLVRNGCIVESGLYDTGFECDNFGAVLFVRNSITVEKDARVAQLLLFSAEETEEYTGQWNKECDKK